MASLVHGYMKVRATEGVSFDDLFLAEYARVVAIAQRVVADAHEAEDVAQDVFYAFYRSHRADAPYAAAWLHRAAVHGALNTIRGKRRRAGRERAGALDRSRLQGEDQGALDPQGEVERAEQRREVRAALARLPEKSAAVLALRYSGLSYAEVAAAVGVNVGQIGTLLRRAEAAIRKELPHETSR